MIKIESIGKEGRQLFTLFLPDGQSLTMTLEFKPLQIGWFMGITYQDFSVKTVRVGVSRNLLAQFSNQLPFGIACFSRSGADPLFIEDFESTNAILCILDQADLDAQEAELDT